MSYIKKILNNRIVQHIAFWSVVFAILLQIFKASIAVEKIDFIYTSIFISTIMLAVYINLYILIPQLLIKKRMLWYSVFLIITVACYAQLNQLIFDNYIDIIFPDYFFISYFSVFEISWFFIAIVFVSSGLRFFKEWYRGIESRQVLADAQKNIIESELKALQSQVNPHFLFNSLNVIYSLALNSSKDSPDAIIKLSDILRYVIYDSAKSTVQLSKEIVLIKNYLDLQNFRIEKPSDVRFNHDIKYDHNITPMLILPLIENGFKHGIKGDIDNTFINVKLRSDKNSVVFEIENNKGKKAESIIEHEGGVGLDNIRKRLKHVYPEKHKLEINENEHTFKVKLQISL